MALPYYRSTSPNEGPVSYKPKMCDASKKRLRVIESAMVHGHDKLTYTELEWLRVAVEHSVRGSGGASPQPLDISSISAVDDVRACRAPQWISVRCHHGNVTWKQVCCRKCSGCRHAWRAKVRALILDGSKGSRVFMWTLTMPEYPSKMIGERFDVLQERWHALLRAGHDIGVRFEYLRVVELQKRGTPHLHIAVKGFRVGQKKMSDTKAIAAILRRLSKGAGFGYILGKTMDFQAARLGGAGVASYMSKYLGKSENWSELQREDGRAIRRYCRSRDWSSRRPLPVWRYARTRAPLSRVEQSTKAVTCVCGEGMLLSRELQVERWVCANRREGSWVAPISVGDYLLEKEKVKWQQE